MKPEDRPLLDSVHDNYAVPEWYVTAEFEPALSRLLASGHLRRTLTEIGPCISLARRATDVFGARFPRRGPASVAHLAALAVIRDLLVDEGYTFVRFQMKKSAVYPAYSLPSGGERDGTPIGLTMRLPEDVMRWQHGHRLQRRLAEVPTLGECPVHVSLAASGPRTDRLMAVRIKDLLKRHPFLQRDAATLIVGVRDTALHPMLEQRYNMHHRALQTRCRNEMADSVPEATSDTRHLAPTLKLIDLPIPD